MIRDVQEGENIMSREELKESIDRILADAIDEELADIRVFAMAYCQGRRYRDKKSSFDGMKI